MAEIDKIIGKIPEALRREEAIKMAREWIKTEEDRTSPLSPVATAACHFIMSAVPNARDDINRFNQELGTDYPSGDIIMAGALLAAALAYRKMILEKHPEVAIELGHMLFVANHVKDQVAESVLAVLNNKVHETGVVNFKNGGISLAIERSGDKDNDKR